MMSQSILRILMLVLFCLVIVAVPARCQTKSDSDAAVIQQLVQEVRLLRQTLQQTNLYGLRGQLLVDRIRLKGDRIDKLTAELESTRHELRQLELQDQSLDEQIKKLATDIDKASNTARQNLEESLKAAKDAATFQKQHEEELREKEAQLIQDLQAEQGSLTDLERKLDALEDEVEHGLSVVKP